MKEVNPQVGILGLKKDKALLVKSAETLRNFEVPFEVETLTKIGTLRFVPEYARSARERGIEVIITTDRVDNLISNIVSRSTRIPVVAIPTIDISDNSSDIDFRVIKDQLRIVQKPIYTVAGSLSLNEQGAINAAIFAVRILALQNEELDARLEAYRAKQEKDVLDSELP